MGGVICKGFPKRKRWNFCGILVIRAGNYAHANGNQHDANEYHIIVTRGRKGRYFRANVAVNRAARIKRERPAEINFSCRRDFWTGR